MIPKNPLQSPPQSSEASIRAPPHAGEMANKTCSTRKLAPLKRFDSADFFLEKWQLEHWRESEPGQESEHFDKPAEEAVVERCAHSGACTSELVTYSNLSRAVRQLSSEGGQPCML